MGLDIGYGYFWTMSGSSGSKFIFIPTSMTISFDYMMG